jgi:uncharacterized protein (TIGR02268 family)
VLPSLLLLAVLQGSPLAQPPPAICQDVQRVELSLERGPPREICVSPGLLTGFVFDSRVVVDLEEEIRFAEVTRGGSGISFMPPGDGLTGERLRLTAHFADGATVTFVLVIHSGRATRQVEVYRDKRTQESFQHEIAQEQAKNQQLQQEKELLQRQLEQLRAECGDPRGLRRLIASNSMDKTGIRAEEFIQERTGYMDGPLTVTRGVSYRSNNRVAVEVRLLNSSDEAWTVSAASLVDAQGNSFEGIEFWQDGGAIPPHEIRLIVVEATARKVQGKVTLVLRDAGSRAITIPEVALP